MVFTSERLIVDNLVPSVLCNTGAAAKCDGTHKVGWVLHEFAYRCRYEGGWEVISIGTHAVNLYHDPKTVVHQYRPWVFVYSKSESDKNLHNVAMPALLALVCVTSHSYIHIWLPRYDSWLHSTMITSVVWDACYNLALCSGLAVLFPTTRWQSRTCSTRAESPPMKTLSTHAKGWCTCNAGHTSASTCVTPYSVIKYSVLH